MRALAVRLLGLLALAAGRTPAPAPQSCPCAEPAHCRSLRPQPGPRREALAFRTAPAAYQTSPAAWRAFDWDKVTILAAYTSLTNASDDPARELLCVAHQHNARVLTWTGSVWGRPSPMAINPSSPPKQRSGEIPTFSPHPDGFRHEAIWRAWVRNLTEFVVASGTDGVMLDFESPGYWNGTGVVDAVCALKASLEAALPGAMVASCACECSNTVGLEYDCCAI